MTRQRDFQRSKVYSWERELFAPLTEDFDLDYCSDLAFELFGRRVVVKPGRGAVALWTVQGRPPTIKLPKWARNRVVIAHEVAHLIAGNRVKDDIPPHGALFMKTFIELLHHQKVAHGPWLVTHARDYGLRVAD